MFITIEMINFKQFLFVYLCLEKNKQGGSSKKYLNSVNRVINISQQYFIQFLYKCVLIVYINMKGVWEELWVPVVDVFTAYVMDRLPHRQGLPSRYGGDVRVRTLASVTFHSHLLHWSCSPSRSVRWCHCTVSWGHCTVRWGHCTVRWGHCTVSGSLQWGVSLYSEVGSLYSEFGSLCNVVGSRYGEGGHCRLRCGHSTVTCGHSTVRCGHRTMRCGHYTVRCGHCKVRSLYSDVWSRWSED